MKQKQAFSVVPTLILVSFWGSLIQAQPFQTQIQSRQVICKQPDRYIGWPTIAKTASGELLVVFSGDRDAHVCPWGKTQMIRSADCGKTWSAPQTINNYPLDDRDAGIIQTKNGTLVISWFTSLAFLRKQDKNPQWNSHIDKLGPEIRRQWLGSWLRRSEDNGATWQPPIRVGVSAPHGPTQLADGRLLFVGIDLKDGEDGKYRHDRNVVWQSADDGKTWEQIAAIAIPDGELQDDYQEPHVVECASGKLLALFRYPPKDKTQCFMRQSESTDGGKTWTTAHPTPIWGYPPHLIRLKNGWILVSYGVRREPFGEYACLSTDEGATWLVNDQFLLHPAPNSDLGYPASVQLDDGSIYTIYYQQENKGEKTCLMATHWNIEGLR